MGVFSFLKEVAVQANDEAHDALSWLYLSQAYRLLSETPKRFDTSTTPCPRSVIYLIASALNSAVYLVPLIVYSPVQFRHY